MSRDEELQVDTKKPNKTKQNKTIKTNKTNQPTNQQTTNKPNKPTNKQNKQNKQNQQNKQNKQNIFFCCALLACHDGRRRSPSVSEIGEKTDFLTFQMNCKNIHQIMRKFGYSEHCVYTGAMLSFIYSLFGFWELIVWSEGFRRYSYYGYFLEDWFWGT